MQYLDRAERKPEAQHAADDAEHEGLGHELAKQPPALRADRFAQRELARSNHTACQQQVRDVDARDQQDESDRAGQHQQCRSDRLDEIVLDAEHVEAARERVRSLVPQPIHILFGGLP